MSEMVSVIRRAESADVRPIEQLVVAAYERYVGEIGVRPLPMDDDYASRVERGEAWIIGDDVDGVIVLVAAEGFLLIDNVAVRPSLQGRGLGRRLVAFAEDRARVLGFTEVRLYTNERMAENRRLYSRLGYEEVGREVIQGRRAVWMRKSLAP